MDLKINGLNEPKLPLNEFTTNLITVERELEFDHSQSDRFTILICVEGSGTIGYNGVQEPFCKGEILLLSACFSNYSLKSIIPAFKVLEVYI